MTTATRPATGLAVRLDRGALLGALGLLAHATARGRATLPITECALLACDGERLTLRATNLDHAASYALPALASTPGAMAVPFDLLKDLIGGLPDGPIELTATDKRALRVSAGRHLANLAGLDPEEFPPIADAPSEPAVEVELRADALDAALRRVVPAADRAVARPAINAVLVRMRAGALTLAATDGFRMAEVVGVPTLRADGEGDAIVPLASVRLLSSVLEERAAGSVVIRVHAGKLHLDAGPVAVVTRLVEGTYPDHANSLAEARESAWTAEFEPGPVLAGLRAAGIFARSVAHVLRVSVEGGMLRLEATAAEVGDARVDVAATIAGEPCKAMFNVAFLVDAIEQAGPGAVRLRIRGATRPCLIEPVEPDGYRAVVMPMAGAC